jgi:type I restriction enzyme S subunit
MANIQTGPFGTQLAASDYVTEGTPVINVRNIGYGDLRPEKLEYIADATRDRLEVHVLAKDDIVFGRKGAVDRHLLVGENESGWLQGSDCIRLRFNTNQVIAQFVSYGFLRQVHQDWMLAQSGSKATMASLNHDILRRITISLPPAHLQSHVIEILRPYDDLIENNRRRMALLEESARQLYQEWFVLLRFPGYEHARITDGVPDGWQRTTISALVESGEIELQTGPFGTQLKASDYTEDGMPVINVRNIGFGDLRIDKLEYVPDSVVDRLQQHVLKAKDIVFGRKGAVDRHVLLRPSQEGWIQGSDCIRLRSHSQRVSTLLLSLAFRETSHKDWMLTQCSNKASLNQDVLGRIVTIIPEHKIHETFIDLVASSFELVGVLEKQSKNARTARDLLLPRLMSGEVAV